MNEASDLTKKERKALNKKRKIKAEQQANAQAKKNKLMTYGVILTALVAVVYLVNNSIVPVPDNEKNKPVDAALEIDWLKGSVDAPVVLVEYSDFQCPACKSYVDKLSELNEFFGDDLAIVYRHFPLKQIHLQAVLAGQAAEAAGMQGKFWGMHDMLFENQDNWAEKRGVKKIFIKYAEALGLDVGQFKKDLNSKDVRGLVKADFLSGLSLRINSTPSFFVNGERITNPNSISEFKTIISDKLTAATASANLE